MHDDTLVLTIIIVLACLTITIFLKPFFDKKYDENFESDFDPKLDLLMIQKDNKIQSPYRFINVEQFNKMIDSIRKIIHDDVVDFTKVCTDMNGDAGIGEQNDQRMTLLCYDDTIAVENTIITHICDFIIDHIKKQYGINMNPYLVFSDFKVNFNISEDILYPLSDSTLYTVHGVRYFTESMLNNLISQNLSVKNVLYTTLLRRGIDVNPNSDNHI
jgi:hypothetical protein